MTERTPRARVTDRVEAEIEALIPALAAPARSGIASKEHVL